MGNRVGMPAPRKELLLLFFKKAFGLYIYISSRLYIYFRRACFGVPGAQRLSQTHSAGTAKSAFSLYWISVFVLGSAPSLRAEVCTPTCSEGG